LHFFFILAPLIAKQRFKICPTKERLFLKKFTNGVTPTVPTTIYNTRNIIYLGLKFQKGFICNTKFPNKSAELINLSPVYTTLNFWYGTDKIGTRTTFLVLGLPI
jgi:hypothetical protein